MKQRHILTIPASALLLLACSCATFQSIDPGLLVENTERLEQLKELHGTWKGTKRHGDEEGEVMVTYRITSGGSAVMETIAPNTAEEMVTFYNIDGDDLVLTHYCTLGNQPKMVARKGGKGSAIHFDYASCGNLDSPDAPHMHSAKLTFIDDVTLKAEWTMFQDAKPTMTAVMELTRVGPTSS